MNLDDMIAAERTAPAEATTTQTAEVWRSLERSFVPVAPPPGAGLTGAKTTVLGKLGGALSSTTGKVVLAATLATAGVVGATQLNPKGAPAPSSPASAPAEQAPAAATVSPPPPPSPLPEPVVEPEPAPEVVVDVATPTAVPKPKVARAPAASRASKPSIQEELALIRRTQSAVRTGNHRVALSLVKQHAKTFPKGAFVEDREALRTLALCVSGNEAGTGTASRFLERWPDSMHRTRIESACD